MKIAVASNNKINVSGHLGRCRGFLIYETEGDKILSKDYRLNTFTHHHHSHEGSEEHTHNHSHQELVNGIKDCNVVIFSSGGWRVIEDLKSNNIYPLLTNEQDAETAVTKYLSNSLEETPENTCHEH